MARQFDSNAANYMSRASVDLGLNGATECSWAFWVKPNSPPASFQIMVSKKQSAAPDIGTIASYFATSETKPNFYMENAGQAPEWRGPVLTVGAWIRCLFTFKRNAITSADGIIYYNGAAQTIDTFTANGYAAGFTLNENSNLLLYGVGESIGNPYGGTLAWVNIWNRQLTPQEVLLDFVNPLNVRNGLLSVVSLCPDIDQGKLGGSMTVNGTLRCVGGPPLEIPKRYVLPTRPRPFAPGLAR